MIIDESKKMYMGNEMDWLNTSKFLLNIENPWSTVEK